MRERIAFWSTAKESLPPLLAVSGLAITQPLLDLFGKNPEFFIASDMSKPEIVAFGLAVALIVPLGAFAVVLAANAVAGRSIGTKVGVGLMAVLGFAFGLQIARHLDVDRTVFAAALGLIAMLGVLAIRSRAAGAQLLTYLAFAPAVFLAFFLFGSETSELLLSGQADAATDVTIDAPAPVVMIVLDEIPTATLMREDGTLNDERFPNFARLAEAGTWYRSGVSLSHGTVKSVPAIVGGDEPMAGGLPTSADHPDTLFTLLGATYDMDVTETATDLCPDSLCAPSETATFGDFIDNMQGALTDATIVYGHTSLPPRFRDDLPAVDQTLAGFVADPAASEYDPAPEPTTDAGAARSAFREELRAKRPEGRGEPHGEKLRRAIAGSTVTGEHDLLFVHDQLPHYPWVRTQTGGVYANLAGPPGTIDGLWGDNQFLITQGLQRHLLQTGYADRLVGELIDKLQSDGVWDDALVVLTADHGGTFTADQPRRKPRDETTAELYNVPLFIKAPRDAGGVVDDEPARTIDILPTIVDLLEIDSDFTFDGSSLVGPGRSSDDQVLTLNGPEVATRDIDGVLDVAARNQALLPTGEGWPAVSAPGRYGALVGTPVSQLEIGDDPGLSWSVESTEGLGSGGRDGAPVRVFLTGAIVGAEPGSDYLVAVNGTVAGVVGFDTTVEAGDYSVLLDESLLDENRNTLELLSVTGPANAPTARSGGRPS